jgi:N-methylhydantoinase A
MTWIVGVDVGGTFTDVFFLDEARGRVEVAKVPSMRGNQAEGFLHGIERHAPDSASIATIVHGTTVATNALLERKGAKAGLITTTGFADVLEMRRRDRPRTWGLWGQYEPVIPRDRRLEVSERTLADGTVRQEVDVDAVRDAARLLRERGAEAVAVVFINAYANAANERAAIAALREVWPNDFVTASSDILPEIREFERTSTAALNAYLQPVVATYLGRLEEELGRRGFAGQLLIVQSNGGVMTVETARERPVRTALSGPAAGVIAAAHIATSAGFGNVVTGDVGGTSFDVSLIVGGAPGLAAQTSIDFGLVVRTPMVEIATIGAGGGSIASIDAGGLLQVGPESAGSDPGPVCYGLGSARPTVTDANLVLGRINAERPIGGKLSRLDVDAARRALDGEIGQKLGLGTEAAAEAVVRVANSRMAGAIRLVSIERGHNPRDFVYMPFGGAGALHAGALMKEVGLQATLVPRYPGVTSALGCVIADMRHDFVQTVNRLLDELDEAALRGAIEEFSARGEALLARSGVAFTSTETVVELDMLYVGQTHTIAVPLPILPPPPAGEGWGGGTTVQGRGFPLPDLPPQAGGGGFIKEAFEGRYREIYGRLLDGIGMRVLNLRVAVIGRRPKLDLALLGPARGDAPSPQRRRVWCDGGWADAAVWPRLDLPVGFVVLGPAILEQPDTTIFLEPDLDGEVDRFGNLLIRRRVA